VKQSQIIGEAVGGEASRFGEPGWRATRLLAVPLLSILVACSGSFFGGEIKVQIQAEDHINQDSPVPVELLVVYDDKLLDYLLSIDAQKWFSERDQVRRDHPDKKSYVSAYWELVPGQPPLKPQPISFGVGARGAVVFANYFSEGKHRVRLKPHRDVVITLQANEFSVKPEFSGETAQ
jgi:type VI secretion system protein